MTEAMDVILDCIFDQVFARMDRGCLLARYKRRQLTDYLSTVIKGSSGDDTQEGCARAVRAAMRFHQTSKQQNGQICLLGKYHNVLYVAATLCFDWKLEDTSIVEELLEDIFACEKTFEKLFIGAILGTKVTHLISGWKSDFRSRDECVTALKYFLDHATKANLWFECGGDFKRFVDVPMDSYGKATPLRVAVQAGQSDAAALLLDFGAEISPVPVSLDSCALQPLLHRVNDFLMEHPEESVPLEVVCCLNLLLREVPMLPRLLPVPQDPKDPHDPPVFLDIDYNPRMYALMPPERSGFLTAPCLKHMCRCVLRQQLREDGLLPYGVSDLLIPETLVQFLIHQENAV